MKNLQHNLSLGLLSPVYLFVGEETLLIEEYIKKVAALAAPDDWGAESLQGEETDPAELVASLQGGGLFSSRRLLVVRNVPWFRRKARKAEDEDGEEGGPAEEEAKADVEPLIRYCASPDPSATLLLTAITAPKNTRLYKAINSAGRVTDFPFYQGPQREAWLGEYFRHAGLKPAPGVAAFLSASCAQGLLSLKNEADKLILYCERQSTVTMDDAQALVSHTAQAAVFALTDCMANRDGPAAARMLQQLLLQGEKPQPLLGLVATQYRNILLVKDLYRLGNGVEQIASQLGMSSYPVRKNLETSRKYTYKQLMKGLELLLNADIDGKTGKGDAARLLELTLLRICLL